MCDPVCVHVRARVCVCVCVCVRACARVGEGGMGSVCVWVGECRIGGVGKESRVNLFSTVPETDDRD